MNSELLTCLLKFVEYFPDYLLALSRTLLRFFGQPLSKQLYTPEYSVEGNNEALRKQYEESVQA